MESSRDSKITLEWRHNNTRHNNRCADIGGLVMEDPTTAYRTGFAAGCTTTVVRARPR